jgi:predicted N-acetyltransferase YhbS
MVEIRILKPADVDSLAPLVDQFVSANRTLTYRPDYRIAFCDAARKVLNDTNAVIFIAEEEGEIVGLITGRISDNGGYYSS